MTTVAQNRWAELITIEAAIETVGSTTQELGGWRWCRPTDNPDLQCVTTADGGTRVLPVNPDYVSEIYGSSDLATPTMPLGSLAGFWAGTGTGGTGLYTPFAVGSSYVAEVPFSADELVLGMHDQAAWQTNAGSYDVEVQFEGANPQIYTIYATQCIYFRYADTGLLGPAPYYEDIDNGHTNGPHRPQTINVPLGATIVTITAVGDPIRAAQVPNEFSYLKLQRYLFDKAKHETLLAKVMVWQRGLNAEDYHLFILRNNTLDNIPITYDCISCNLSGPTIVAINKSVRAPLTRIMNAINRSTILPLRTTIS